jgi:hypothetical protein
MADALGAVTDVLSLITTLYKNFAQRNTAHATLQNHIRNFTSYQVMITGRLETLIKQSVPVDTSRRQQRFIQIQAQAQWVLEQDVHLSDWLDDAGFRRANTKAGVYQVRRRSRPAAITIVKRPSKPGPLKFPRFGVTSKETSFDSLLEKLKEAFERLDSMYSDYDQVSPNAAAS